jgi:hypothetical protein
MKPLNLSHIAALAAILILGVSATPSEAGKGDCMHWYNAAHAHLKRGDHDGYNEGMRRFSQCLAKTAGHSPNVGQPKKKAKKQH